MPLYDLLGPFGPLRVLGANGLLRPAEPSRQLGRGESRRSRRIGRYALGQIDRGMVDIVQGLGAVRTPVDFVVDLQHHFELPIRGTASIGVGVAGWRVLLAGVAARARWGLITAAEAGPLHLTDGGRYGRYWWIEVGGDHPVEQRLVMVGSHLRTVPTDDRGGGGEGFPRGLEGDPKPAFTS